MDWLWNTLWVLIGVAVVFKIGFDFGRDYEYEVSKKRHLEELNSIMERYVPRKFDPADPRPK